MDKKNQKINLIKWRIAKKGKVNELILNQALENFDNRSNKIISFDTKDFDISLCKRS